MNTIFAKLLCELEKQRDTVLVSIAADRGSAPRCAGSQTLMGRNSRIVGTIGGGAVEKRSEELALTPLLQSVGFRVTVMDCRAEFANAERFPMAEQVICGDYLKIGSYLELNDEDYVAVMTNGHSHDSEVQKQVLRSPPAYIGVIGSRSKTAAVNEKLRAAGITEEAIRRVHAPVGVSIKAVTPEEIAVSIAGEMIYERALRREAAGAESRGCPMHGQERPWND